MVYNLTIEEQSKIDTLWERLEEKIEQRKAAPNETPKETVLDYIQRLNKEFNNILGEIEEEHFKSLKSPQEIIKDAEKVIEDAILFEYAGTTEGAASTEENKITCINLTKEYTQLMGEIEFLSWNYMQEQYKKAKENQEPPKVKLVKSGMLYFLQQRALKRHIAALKGTTQEEELNKVINDCLERSKYIIDDELVNYAPILTPSPRAKYQKKELTLNTNYDVAMANSLILNGVNTLNATELKLLRLAIMQSKKDDTELYEYEIGAQELANFLNLNIKNLYTHLEAIVEHIHGAHIKVKDERTQKIHTQSWVDSCDYSKGIFTIKLAIGLKPYLLGLRGCFSKIKMEEYIAYKSKHTIIIRELLEAKMGAEKPHGNVVIEIPITLEELKRVTNTAKGYEKISRFRSQVLDKAIQEINDYSWNYHVSATPYKNGKTIEGYNFTIESQAHYNEHHKQEQNIISVTPGKKRKPKAQEKEQAKQLSLKDIFDKEF